MLYERTAFLRQPDELAERELALLHERGEVGPALVLKDAYILDFLWISRTIIQRRTSRMPCCAAARTGSVPARTRAGLSFIARQKRIQLDGKDFYIDLLFYNRKLRR